jgi:hypothetical protein
MEHAESLTLPMAEVIVFPQAPAGTSPSQEVKPGIFQQYNSKVFPLE